MATHSTGWSSPPHPWFLQPGDVNVWRIGLIAASTQIQSLTALLSADELDRARRFHFKRDRDRFVIVRGALRALLGIYVQIPPEQISFHYGAHGKPYLIAGKNETVLNFNVSHSCDLALLAFAWERAIGIDLEYVRPEIAMDPIAERFFSAREFAALRVLPESLQPMAFFHGWTRKEALIKATGEGLSRSLDQFSMSLVPGEPARLLEMHGEPENLSKWSVQNLEPGPGYAAALVVQNPVEQIHCWEFVPHADTTMP